MAKTSMRFEKHHEILRTTFPNHLSYGKGYMDIHDSIDLAELLLEGQRAFSGFE